MVVLDYESRKPPGRARRLLAPKYHGPFGLRYLLVPALCSLPTLLLWSWWGPADVGDAIVFFLALPFAIPVHLYGAFRAARVLVHCLAAPPDYWAALICLVPLLANMGLALFWLQIFWR